MGKVISAVALVALIAGGMYAGYALTVKFPVAPPAS